MQRSLIEIARLSVDLTPRPIEPCWILEGNPEATSCVLSQSADGLATTMVWHCTEGKFDWFYDFDETVLILDGSIVLESDGIPPTRYVAGDVIFFRDGAHAKWHVEGHVRKLAFLRKPHPVLLGFALRTLSKIKRTLVPVAGRKVGGLVVAMTILPKLADVLSLC